ncbi:progestin and adipoQ receptor family member 3 isoform X1 [Cephus cinctus]|uniref:Progestin and adipoQ receptor family member 3 isoform X1 n=2 Tax=Cephus cinctus TaxID=211228 RepID=A0AAJ7VYW2_CEPCN|nr:progestin and adipoQ receptor family member 3 isoform X1 [Cephus cinctus]XP_024938285.1 progestin and adipoQ receptor family member 3 isoform X1 [Cephus cinctus]XP_024938286.1 progestin and adipoQ receptor family member 3 isoform X1 [Cephus cinctus]XP_024938287.1 progestin and adipoQ receptor family member 3 isoform X1 [Cephus cinctus]
MMKLLAGVEEVSDENSKNSDDHHVRTNKSHEKQSTQLIQEAAKTLVKKTKHEESEDLADSPIHGKVTPEDEEQMRQLLPFEKAPVYLQFNPFILHGYRGYLTTKLCLERKKQSYVSQHVSFACSIFWWTNETINIWSHIFGWMLFLGLTLYDLCLLNIHAPFGDKLIVALLLICFQACMILSSMYHTFSCRSEKDYWCFLSFDLFGIALSLLAIYMSGVYYAFWCHKDLQQFYLITVLLIFVVAMLLQVPRFNVNGNVKLIVFVAWAAYGVLPTLHWSIAMGGMENPMVRMLLPRVLGMYVISGGAFLIYLSKVPERFFPGWVDYVGSSHQWWHALVVLALYYWHNTGMLYVEYRLNHGCPTNMRL